MGGGSMGGGSSSRQQLGPHFLNMRRLRAAALPGASMHGSARALATFYDGLLGAPLPPGHGAQGAGYMAQGTGSELGAPLLPGPLVLTQLPRLATTTATSRPGAAAAGAGYPAEAAEPVRWAAGFQLGEAVQAGRAVEILGHGAAGGTVGFCIPASGLALSITVNKLSPARTATRRLVEVVLAEFGVRVTRGAGLLQD